MKTPEIIVNYDDVTIDGQRVQRLTAISRIQWLRFWENACNGEDRYKRGYDEGYEFGREESYERGVIDGMNSRDEDND